MAGLNLPSRQADQPEPVHGSAAPPYQARFARYAMWLAVLAIVVLGFGARVYNTSWDEGTHAHPDERHLTLVSIALELPSGPGEYFDTANSRLNPYNLENTHSFVYGTLPVIVTKIAAVATDRDSYEALVIVGRQLTALFAAATLLIVFLIGRRLYGDAAGLIAAALMASAPLAIQHAHFFIVDTHLTFFMAAALYFSVRVAQGGGWMSFGLAGLMLGCAMACKVTGVVFLPVLFAAVGLRLWPHRHERWTPPVQHIAIGVVLALLLAFLAFRVFQPYAFDGLVSLNSQWVEDQRSQERLLGGEVAFPPSIQWIDRTSYLYPLQDMVTWGMGPAFGLAAWLALIYAGYRLVRYREPLHLLPLLFVLVYFGFMGQQFSLYMRYFLPLYPVLAGLAGYGLVSLYQGARGWSERLGRPWPAYAGTSAVGIVLVASLLAGLAYFSIYTRDFTRAEATRWLHENVAPGSVLAGEEWDEILPLRGVPGVQPMHFEVFGLGLYHPDSTAKFGLLMDNLDRADYVTVSSNRLMNSIPRNRLSYPLTAHYHEMLLNGDLGFDLVAEFTSYPGLLGIEFPDHGVQESWSSYDHPRVLIFEKAPRYSREHLERLFAGPYTASSLTPGAAANNLLLSESDLTRQQTGGTWTDVFSEGGIAGRFPALLWFGALQAAAFAVTPVALLLFRRLPDRGYLLSKPLGLLLLAYPVWLSVRLGLLPFHQLTVLAGLLLLAVVGGALAYRNRVELARFVRERWRLIVCGEMVFCLAFLAFYLLRMENPDLWHPFRGGEKPMDLAYLTAVVRSTTLPPYDPWFSGGYINYYYLGQFLTATLTRLTAIPPEVAYNLAIPTFFALTAAATFSTAYNLAEASRRLLAGASDAAQTTRNRLLVARAIPAWSAYACGLLGVFLVAIAGNLDGVGQVVERLSQASSFQAGTGIPVLESVLNSLGGVWQVVFRGAEVVEFDYWRSSRMLPPTISITEFPFFSFLFADLHAHMMAIAFQVLAIGTGLALVLRRRDEPTSPWSDIGLIAVLGLIVGSLRWINSWDYPPFLLLALATVLISERHLAGGAGAALLRIACKGGLLVLLSFAFYLPFIADYRAPVAGLAVAPEQTPVHQYLAHFGLFAAFIAAGLFIWLLRALKPMRLLETPSETAPVASRVKRDAIISVLMFTGILVGFLSLLLGISGQPLVAVLLPVLTLVVLLALREAVLVRRPDGGIRLFVLALVTLGLGLSLGVDVVVLEGDIVRMNTVFKFYLHVWVVFALAAAFFAWQLVFVVWRPMLTGPPRFPVPRIAARAALSAMALLLLGVAIYPAFATPIRLNDRFNDLPAGLDGMAYMETAQYSDERGLIDLSADLEGIRWMRQNVEGTPTIVEGQAELYRWGGRFSIYTGLPTVVGWDWHQRQQRGDLAYMVTQRGQQVREFYSNPDPEQARDFLRAYGVRYVILGQVERFYYDEAGLAKFEAGLDGALEVAFQNEALRIYHVLPEALAIETPAGASSR